MSRVTAWPPACPHNPGPRFASAEPLTDSPTAWCSDWWLKGTSSWALVHLSLLTRLRTSRPRADSVRGEVLPSGGDRAHPVSYFPLRTSPHAGIQQEECAVFFTRLDKVCCAVCGQHCCGDPCSPLADRVHQVFAEARKRRGGNSQAPRRDPACGRPESFAGEAEETEASDHGGGLEAMSSHTSRAATD